VNPYCACLPQLKKALPLALEAPSMQGHILISRRRFANKWKWLQTMLL
jgi:hypothetical protein